MEIDTILNQNRFRENLVNFLSSNREIVLNRWVEARVVKERLNVHDIDITLFKTHFAKRILDYFINVCSLNSSAGECPALSVMLDFFKHKNIPLNDIFRICVNFKNAIILESFEEFKNLKKRDYEEFLNLVNYIFDSNFEGVMIEYIGKNYLRKPIESFKSNLKFKHSKEVYREVILDDDFEELCELEADIQSLSALLSFNNKIESKYVVEFLSKLKRYGEIVSSYPDFSRVGIEIINFASSLESRESEVLEKIDNISILLECFVNDLMKWRSDTFEDGVERLDYYDDSISTNLNYIRDIIDGANREGEINFF